MSLTTDGNGPISPYKKDIAQAERGKSMKNIKSARGSNINELKQFNRALVQKLDTLISQTNCMENECSSNKEGQKSVNNIQEPAVRVQKAATSKKSLRKMTKNIWE